MTPGMRLSLREGPGASEDHSRVNHENRLKARGNQWRRACGWRRATLAHMSSGDQTLSGDPHRGSAFLPTAVCSYVAGAGARAQEGLQRKSGGGFGATLPS